MCWLFLFIFSNVKIFHFPSLSDCKGKMKVGISWNLRTSGVNWDIEELYLMFQCQIYMNIFIYKILYKNCRCKNAPNLKTTISQRSLANLGLLLLLVEFNNFSFLIYIIITSVSHVQNSHQWQCSIIVMWYRRRHVYLFK